MKPILYIAFAGSFALGACSSTYQTTQTPDDVYYSPRQEQYIYSSRNSNSKDENATYTEAEEGGNYVTYQDEDQGYYQRRINRFSNANNYSGGYWDNYSAASNLYINNYYGMSPYSGFGMAYSPYSSFYNSSLSFGLGLGSGYYHPWYGSFYGGALGYPYLGSYYPSYYPSYYIPYYGNKYYGGGFYGDKTYRRPSNTYGPVGNSNERISRSGYSTSDNVNGGAGYIRPSRSSSVQPSNNYNGGTINPATDRPRRVFQQSSSERPITRPANNYQMNNGNDGYSRPQREYSHPSPAPSYTPPSSGGGRINSSGGGSSSGGYSRPTRGGR